MNWGTGDPGRSLFEELILGRSVPGRPQLGRWTASTAGYRGAVTLPDTDATILWLFSAVVLAVAYFVRGVTGFGSGLIAIPMLALFMPLSLVVPLVVFLDYVASASHGLKDRAQIQWREILPLLPFTALGVLAGLYLFRSVDSTTLAHALGVFILVYALYTLLVREGSWLAARPWAVPAGTLGGLVGTLFGTGGPFYVVYLQLWGPTKAQFRATASTVFLLEGSGRLIGYYASGFFTRDALLLFAAALPLMGIGLYAGNHIHTTISEVNFKRLISLLLIGSGAALLLK